MAQEQAPPRPNLTNAGTDTESGQDGIEGKEAYARALWALSQMFERGLLTTEEYEHACANIPPPQAD